MSKRQYRWFSPGLWQSQSGNALWVLINPANSGKRVTVCQVEVHVQKHLGGFGTVDLLVGSTSLTASHLGGEQVRVVAMNSTASLPEGVSVHRQAAVENSNRALLRIRTVRLTTASAWFSSAYGSKLTRYRRYGRSGWHVDHFGQDNIQPITLNPGEFLAVANLNTSQTQETVPLEVQARFNINGQTFAAVTPCHVGFNGTAAFVILNRSTYPLYLKRLFLRELGTADTPYFRLVPIGAVDPGALGDQWRLAYGQPLDSQYGGYQSGDPYFILDTPLLPYLVPHQYLAEGSSGSPKGVNYLHTKDFWGPTYSVWFPEFASISATSSFGFSWPMAYRHMLNTPFNLVLQEGEGLAMVSSAETATTNAAVGTSGWQPYDFSVIYNVEPKSIPVIRAIGMVPGSRWAIQKKTTNELVAQAVTIDGTMEYTYYQDDVPVEMLFKVRKASESPYYKPFEVTFLLTVDGVTIPVSQVKDE